MRTARRALAGVVVLGLVGGAMIGAAPGRPSPAPAAVAYIRAHAADVALVRSALSAPLIVLRLVRGHADAAARSQLAPLAEKAEGTLNAIASDFGATRGTSRLARGERALALSAPALGRALAVLVAFCAEPSPARLASFTVAYRRAASRWNAALEAVWRAAGLEPPGILLS